MTVRALVLALLMAAAGSALGLDHYDPVALHAYAIERMREGDLHAAGILLARAARLAPADERIARTRRALQAMCRGESVALEAVPPPPPRSAPGAGQRSLSPPIPPEPPPIWAPK